MLETDHLQPPRENNGTRKPLDPRRRKGMFLGSNSTLVFGMVNNAWIETRFEKIREKGSAVYLCRGAAAYLRAVDVFPASCATLTELSLRRQEMISQLMSVATHQDALECPTLMAHSTRHDNGNQGLSMQF